MTCSPSSAHVFAFSQQYPEQLNERFLFFFQISLKWVAICSQKKIEPGYLAFMLKTHSNVECLYIFSSASHQRQRECKSQCTKTL